MQPCGRQQTSQVYDACAVERQCFYGGATAGSSPEQLNPIVAPGKMLTPGLLAGIEERYCFARERVCVFCPGELATVAAKTSPSQIFQRCCTTQLPGLDVIDGEAIGRESVWATAIFAKLLRPLSHLLSEAGRNPFRLRRHWRDAIVQRIAGLRSTNQDL